MAVAPGPERPVVFADVRADPLGFLTELTSRFGDLTRHVTGDAEVFVFNRPDLARRVLKERRGDYTKAGTPDDAMLSPLLGEGLLTSEGEVWARQRRLAEPSFHQRRVEGFARVMTDAAEELLARWRPQVGTGEAVRVDHDMTAVTLTVVSRALLGSQVGEIGARFGQAVDTLNRFMGHYDPDEPGGADASARASFANAKAFLDMVVRMLVQGRRITLDDGAPPGDDLLSTLLTVRDADTGERLSDEELRDQVITMLMAGHETTAKALTWTLYLLDRHPAEADRLTAELDQALGGRTPTIADLPSLGHCRRVIEESIRLRPPVWLISRLAAVDDEVDGVRIPAGSLVCVSPYLLHRHPRHWPAPDRFDPDRFTAEKRHALPPFLYLPFGGGPRKCIGRSFALIEAQLVLATLWQHVRPRLVPGHPVEPEALVTLRPRDGMPMTLDPA
jgi:enediyne biosynthesis protein E7